MKNIHTEIMRNGGYLFSSRSKILPKNCYYILADTEQYMTLVKILRENLKGKTKV
jgi:hypothetical protein